MPRHSRISFAALVFPCLLILSIAFGQTETGNTIRHVDPFIGTGGHGHTYPGASVPFGMVQLSPDAGKSGWDWCSGYHYSDSGLVGFSHTHLSGTGCGDLGDILFMPTTSSRSLEESYRSPFSHQREHAEPGYYSVFLEDSRVTVQLTATLRAGFQRYTFPSTDSSRVIINLKYGQDDIPIETYMKVEGPALVTGYRFSNGWAANQKVFFAARFSHPFAHEAMGSKGVLTDAATEAKGKDVKGVFYFPTHSDSIVLVKVGISAVSIEGALKNLDSEIPGWDFDAVRGAASEAWQRELQKVRVTSSRPELLRTYYTSLYHTMLAPTLYGDIDGQYRGADGAVHQSSGFENYSTFSLWDTYRAAHPLYTLIEPERVSSMVQSMLAFAREGGYLPVWPLAANETNTMVGYHAVPVIADAYLKGFGGFDPNEAFEAMKKSAFRDTRGLRFYTMSAPAPPTPAGNGVHTPQAEEFTSTLILPGYARSIGGETISYHSSHPLAKQALVVRATDGKHIITWETPPLPQKLADPYVTFVWLAGIASAKGAHRFELSVNGTLWFVFTTAKDAASREWKVQGKNSASLSFQAAMTDVFGDLFGNMVMRLPASAFTPNKPVTIQILGENGNSPDWVMIFQYALRPKILIENEFGIIQDQGISKQLIKVEIEHLSNPARAMIAAPGARSVRTNILPGLNTFYLALPAAQKTVPIVVTIALDRQPVVHREVLLKPVRPFGYVPADKENESVSKTLEYAIDDWCIAQVAKALAKKEDYNLFMKRAANYKNLFDSTTGFMRGKNFDGSWVSPFDPRFSTGKQPEYTEGNAWQYTWLVPHDIAGLVQLMGGPARFAVKLDSLFNQSSNLEGTGAPPDVSGLVGLYAHGNEPSHHVAYMFDYVGMPWRTQELTHSIMESFYKPGPDGLCGNEDCGQMSAWYVLSALGIYPVNPADGTFEIGSPMIERADIDVGGGKTFTITAQNASATNMFIQSAKLNSAPLEKPWITYQDIKKGGILEFIMGSTPNTTWGSAKESSPPSMTWRGKTD